MADGIAYNINIRKLDGGYASYDIGAHDTNITLDDVSNNNFLVNTPNSLNTILPLKFNKETISSDKDFNTINTTGYYDITAEITANKPPFSDNTTVGSSLLVLNNVQIAFKGSDIYTRKKENDKWDDVWSKGLSTEFTKASDSAKGTRGLVPAPESSTYNKAHFLGANGIWNQLEDVYARLGTSETFTAAPTFQTGFKSEGVVSITANDPDDGKALSVEHGISAGGEISAGSFCTTNKITCGSIKSNGNITVTSNGITVTGGDISVQNQGDINATGEISGAGLNSSNGIKVTTGGITVTSEAKSDISVTKGDIYTNEGNIYTNEGFIKAKGNITSTNGNISASNGQITASTLNITSTAVLSGIVTIKDTNEASTNSTSAGALQVAGGIYASKNIYAKEGVYNSVWNDLVDSIPVNNEAELEPGYCYCIKNNKYLKSSKYMDTGIIGIHSDTYGFKMGGKPDCKQLDCAVSGFVLAYVDKEYLPGTALTCTKDGRLTKIKSKDKQRFPEKIVATYWKDEPNEEWGSDNRKVKVNGRKWVKIK